MQRRSINWVIDKYGLKSSEAKRLKFYTNGAMRRGEREDLATPIRKTLGSSWETVLKAEMDGWLKSVQEIGSEVLSMMESKNRAKLGPWSVQPIWEDWGPDMIPKYYTSQNREAPADLLATLEENLSSIPTFRAISIEEVTNRLASRTHSGLPWVQNPWKAKLGEIVNDVEKQRLDNAPNLAFARKVPSGEKIPKLRLVQGHSKIETINGGRFVYPYLDLVKEMDPTYISFHGPDRTIEVVWNNLKRSYEQGIPVHCVDIATFDMDVHHSCIRLWVETAMTRAGFPEMEIERHVARLLEMGIVAPDGYWNGGMAGLTSGQISTTPIGTEINKALCLGYLKSIGSTPLWYHFQGDDGTFSAPGIDPESFSKYCASQGFTTHPDKQFYSEDGSACTYLQRAYDVPNQLKGVYPGERFYVHACRYEGSRKGWSDKDDTIRWLAQLSNLLEHPMLERAIQFMMRVDQLHKLGTKVGVRKFVTTHADSSSYLAGQRDELAKGNTWRRNLLVDTDLGMIDTALSSFRGRAIV